MGGGIPVSGTEKPRHEETDLLTVSDAAMAARRSVRTIRRAYRSAKLRAYRDGNGRGVRIRYGDLCEWMMAGSAAAFSPPTQAAPPTGKLRHGKRASDRGSGASQNLLLLRAVRQREAKRRSAVKSG
jgi:excisionase family DNA binding protein